MHTLYPPTTSLITIKETRDVHFPQLCRHAICYNKTLAPIYKKNNDYQFQILASDWTKDHLYSRVTKTTNPHDFWFKKTSTLLQFRFNFFQPKKLEFLKLGTSNSSSDQVLSSKNSTRTLVKTSVLITHYILRWNIISLTTNSHHPIHRRINAHSTYLTRMTVSVITTHLKSFPVLLENFPFIVQREAPSTQELPCYEYHNEPPPSLTTRTPSLFHLYNSQPTSPTTVNIYIHLLTSS